MGKKRLPLICILVILLNVASAAAISFVYQVDEHNRIISYEGSPNNGVCTGAIGTNSCSICPAGVPCSVLGQGGCQDGEYWRTGTYATFNDTFGYGGRFSIIGGEYVQCFLNGVNFQNHYTHNNCGAFGTYDYAGSLLINGNNSFVCRVTGGGSDEDSGIRMARFSHIIARTPGTGTVKVKDKEILLGTIEELISPNIYQATTAWIAEVKSPQPNVMVWTGNKDEYTRKETTDKTDEVWACADTDSNNQCDYQQGGACLSAGGDWYMGYCCGTTFPCGYAPGIRTFNTVYVKSGTGGVLTNVRTTTATGYTATQLEAIYYRNFVSYAYIRTTPATGYTKLNQSIIYIDYNTYSTAMVRVSGTPGTGYTPVKLFEDHSIKAWCGNNSQNEWEWAVANDTGAVHNLSNCPGAILVGTGQQLAQCGTDLVDSVAPFDPSGFLSFSLGTGTRDYYCDEAAESLTECAGNLPPFSGGPYHETGEILDVSGTEYYCASDGDYTTDLDSKDKESCEGAGFNWTGNKCCSEADDPSETYEDPGGSGACWDKEYLHNGEIANDGTAFVYNGTIQGCTSAQSLPCVNPPSGMQRWFTGDNTAADHTGQGGALIGTPVYGTGLVDGAFVFSGTSKLDAQAGGYSSFWGANQDFTIDAWIKPKAQDPVLAARVLFFGRSIACLGGASSCSQGDGISIYHAPRGDLVFTIISSGVNHIASVYDPANHGPSFWDDTWHHVAFTRQGSTMKTYIDGTLIGGNAAYTSAGVASASVPPSVSVGGHGPVGTSPGEYFNGSMDEVEFFTRALSQSEIQAIYAAKSYGKCKSGSGTTGGLPHPNPVCTVFPAGSASGEVFCSNAGEWKHDNSNSNRSILKSVNWTIPSDQLEQDCCSKSSCWTGDEAKGVGGCQLNQTNDGTSLNYFGFRCEDGVWIYRVQRFTPNKQFAGYCATNSQCLVDPAGNPAHNNQPGAYFGTVGNGQKPQCINDKQFYLDNYCENGIWSTRTKQIGLALLDYASTVSPESYRVFCGTYAEALNVPASVQNFVNVNCAVNGSTNSPCVNNFCVAEMGTGVAWGVSLNNRVNVNDPAKGFLLNPQGLAINPNSCDNVNSGNEFKECSGKDGLWYNAELNSLIFIPSGSLEPFSLTEFFLEFISNPLQALQYFVSTRLHNPGVGNKFNFFNNTHTFNKLYAAHDGDKNLFAFFEQSAYIRDEEGVLITSIPQPRDYIGVRYEGITLVNPCYELIQKYDGKAACINATGEVEIVTDVYQQNTASPIKNAWRDLTAKLRPGG